jgi:hypothetical protein
VTANRTGIAYRTSGRALYGRPLCRAPVARLAAGNGDREGGPELGWIRHSWARA